MASGDAQRVWFPEMLEALEARGSASWSWDEMLGFVFSVAGLLARCPGLGRREAELAIIRQVLGDALYQSAFEGELDGAH